MITVLLLIFDPTDTWERIEKARRSVLSAVILYLVPLFLVCLTVEGLGLTQLGRTFGPLDRRVEVSLSMAIAYETVHAVSILAIAFGGASLLKRTAASFHSRCSYQQCFVTLAYSLGPLLLLRVVDGWPEINTWICWGIGVLLSVSLLYRGIPRVLRPDPSNALGLYLFASVLLIIATGLAHFLATLVLNEKIRLGTG